MSEVQYVTNFDSKLFVTATIALNLERVEAVQIADRDEKRIVVSTEGSAVSRAHLELKGEDARQFLKHYFAFCGQNVPQHFLDMFGARIVKGNCEHAWQERTLHHPMGGVTLSRVCKLCGEAGPL